jgi:hypothetical protein
LKCCQPASHECGHIIRIFEAPESKRVTPFTSQKHLKIAMDEVKGEVKKIIIIPWIAD